MDAGNSTNSQTKHGFSTLDVESTLRRGVADIQRTQDEEHGHPPRRNLREFVKRDLGADIGSAGTAGIVRPQRPTSILLVTS